MAEFRKRPYYQTLLRVENPPKVREILHVFFAPLKTEGTWAQAAIDKWIENDNTLNKPLVISDISSTLSIKGDFLKNQNTETFNIKIIKNQSKDATWIVNYTGKRTNEKLTVHVQTILEYQNEFNKELNAPVELLDPLRTLNRTYRCIDGVYEINTEVKPVGTKNEIKLLVSALISRTRVLPILVITEPWYIDPKAMAKQLEGLAHIVAMQQAVTYQLSNVIGKNLSVFQGYARLYSTPLYQEAKKHLIFSPEELINPGSIERLVKKIEEETLRILMVKQEERVVAMNDTVQTTKQKARNTSHALSITEAIERAKKEAALDASRATQEPQIQAEDEVDEVKEYQFEVKEISNELQRKSHERPFSSRKISTEKGHIGAWVTYGRMRKGLTQKELAARVGITGPAINMLEARANPKSPKLGKILELLELTEEEIQEVPKIFKYEEVTQNNQNNSDKINTKLSHSASSNALKILEEIKNKNGRNGDRNSYNQITTVENIHEKHKENKESGTNDEPWKHLEERIIKEAANSEANKKILELEIEKIIQRIQKAEKIQEYIYKQLEQIGLTNNVDINPNKTEDIKTALSMLQEAIEKSKTEVAITPSPILPEENQSQKEVTWDGPYPPSLEPRYVAKFLEPYAETVILHNRAIRGLKGSIYNNPQRVYQALEILAKEYVPLKRKEHSENGESSRKFKEVETRFETIGLQLEKMKNRTLSNEYLIEWNGQNYQMDRVLKSKSSPTDARRCLRIYFFWDDKAKRIVIGWLPSHFERAGKP